MFKDGDFNKDYDRAETIRSMATFLKDPTGHYSIFSKYLTLRYFQITDNLTLRQS